MKEDTFWSPWEAWARCTAAGGYTPLSALQTEREQSASEGANGAASRVWALHAPWWH